MTAPDFAIKPVLRGRRVTLRPFTGQDGPLMGEILSDPEVRRLTGSVTSSAQAQTPEPVDQRLLAWYATRSDQPDRLDLAVEDAGSGRLLGEVVLNEYDPRERTCNLRMLLGPSGRDRGLGTEAVRLVCEYALGPLGLRTLTLEVYDINPRARRVYDKIGFVPVRTRAAALMFDGIAVGATEMELTADRLSPEPR